ncbi:hypothetical protein [Lacisediminihabitans profunda]|uniref:Uncharacterized protein n=1 Tax=Lacisediminihabitans profunda TaxID=2594790 RepID=A0A5C8UQD8_9MICO|nr:hypothetical protein [Lacisediminihabitans profunda]TXN30696.1 hypothetical protein FVP33_09305 [Lacisediminihabitans profunda]
MSTSAPRRAENATARRVGYALAVVINGLLLYGINVWPGWRVLPFLTEETTLVLGLVTLSLIAGMVVNAVYVVADQTWLKALGDLITLAIGMAVLVGFWEVFPFDFTGSSLGWGTVARVVLIVAMVGTALGLAVQFVVLIASLLHGSRRSTGPR